MQELPEGSRCSLGGHEFHFSLAVTALELMHGLRGVTSLEPYDGMLFDFGCNFSPIMTPNGLRFPVDVAFITSGGQIVEIHRLDPADGFTRSTTRRDIRFALEVPVGFFETHSIKIGDTLEF
jgi:uncharacterized membrane protein (UPF0127 family)